MNLTSIYYNPIHPLQKPVLSKKLVLSLLSSGSVNDFVLSVPSKKLFKFPRQFHPIPSNKVNHVPVLVPTCQSCLLTNLSAYLHSSMYQNNILFFCSINILPKQMILKLVPGWGQALFERQECSSWHWTFDQIGFEPHLDCRTHSIASIHHVCISKCRKFLFRNVWKRKALSVVLSILEIFLLSVAVNIQKQSTHKNSYLVLNLFISIFTWSSSTLKQFPLHYGCQVLMTFQVNMVMNIKFQMKVVSLALSIFLTIIFIVKDVKTISGYS